MVESHHHPQMEGGRFWDLRGEEPEPAPKQVGGCGDGLSQPLPTSLLSISLCRDLWNADGNVLLQG